MCHPFSCIVTKDRRILRHSNPNVHSHESMINEHKLVENKTSLDFQTWLRIECTPPSTGESVNGKEIRDYSSHPATWRLKVDEKCVPLWFEGDRASYEKLIFDAAEQWWKKHVKKGCYSTVELDKTNERVYIKRIIYFKNNLVHRKNQPAMTLFWDNGKISECIYAQDGLKHRTNKPAVISFSKNGVKEYEMYYVKGECYRRRGPTIVYYYSTGAVASEQYYKYRKLHNDKGPAEVEYYRNGVVQLEWYRLLGQPHRDNKPALLEYTRSGKLKRASFYKNGYFVRKAKIDRKTNQPS